MAGQIKVPPSDDFTGFCGLVSKQGDHFGPMVAWTGKQCSDVDGLDGLLTVIIPTVKGEAEQIGDLLKQCQKGMGTIKDKVTTVDQELRTEDEKNAAALKTAFPDMVSGVPDISTLGTPAGEQLNFNDEDINLKEPSSEKAPSGSILTGLIAGQIPGAKDKDEESMFKKIFSGEGVKGKLSNAKDASIDKTKGALGKQVTGAGNDIWIADKAFQMVTGHSFIDLLLKPLLGDWDRLMYLHDAYDTLGDACYTVAGTLRKGSWKIGSEWQGDTATAFDSYMFRWTNGIGGVGDRAKVIAGYYKDGYEAILALVQIVVSYASNVIDNEVKELAKEAAKVIAGDAIIETVGLGPEDPAADVLAAAWTAWRGVKIYKRVREVVNCLEQIQNYYNDIRQAVELIQSLIEKLQQGNSGAWGDQSAGGLMQDVEQHGFDFEKQSGWSAKDGASRTGYLAAL
ncbi:hypothetical protein ABIA39_003724 [Nocardia sp. GAS34]|uniref:hypothetical protein n=1 Tax=unclassified Nocardia TaxID=2637762 RepID=UPI003D1F5F37